MHYTKFLSRSWLCITSIVIIILLSSSGPGQIQNSQSKKDQSWHYNPNTTTTPNLSTSIWRSKDKKQDQKWCNAISKPTTNHHPSPQTQTHSDDFQNDSFQKALNSSLSLKQLLLVDIELYLSLGMTSNICAKATLRPGLQTKYFPGARCRAESCEPGPPRLHTPRIAAKAAALPCHRSLLLISYQFCQNFLISHLFHNISESRKICNAGHSSR